tara:strand:+ start:34 stop:195 length:162 start_codon:yes stop_codon:yes gene_type:complete
MREENNKVWLWLDSAIRKLKQGKHWVTSADEWKENIDTAIKNLEEAKRKVEND